MNGAVFERCPDPQPLSHIRDRRICSAFSDYHGALEDAVIDEA